jgi:hypothetical protein
MPPGRDVVVIDGTAITTMLRALVLFPPAFDAMTVKLNVPAAVGVPEICPSLLKVKPGSLPLSNDQDIGVVLLASSV